MSQEQEQDRIPTPAPSPELIALQQALQLQLLGLDLRTAVITRNLPAVNDLLARGAPINALYLTQYKYRDSEDNEQTYQGDETLFFPALLHYEPSIFRALCAKFSTFEYRHFLIQFEACPKFTSAIGIEFAGPHYKFTALQLCCELGNLEAFSMLASFFKEYSSSLPDAFIKCGLSLGTNMLMDSEGTFMEHVLKEALSFVKNTEGEWLSDLAKKQMIALLKKCMIGLLCQFYNFADLEHLPSEKTPIVALILPDEKKDEDELGQYTAHRTLLRDLITDLGLSADFPHLEQDLPAAPATLTTEADPPATGKRGREEDGDDSDKKPAASGPGFTASVFGLNDEQPPHKKGRDGPAPGPGTSSS